MSPLLLSKVGPGQAGAAAWPALGLWSSKLTLCCAVLCVGVVCSCAQPCGQVVGSGCAAGAACSTRGPSAQGGAVRLWRLRQTH